MSYLSHNQRQKVCLRRVWIRLTTAYLLCTREFRQNNALALQFWCLSNALTLRVRALDASKSQRACIILSKFTRRSKYAVIIVGFFIPVSSLKVFGHSIHSERKMIYLGKSTQALQNDTLSYHDYSVSGSSSQHCSGMPLKLLCVFS